MYYDNLTLLTDLYELTMMQGYFKQNIHDKTVVFEVFYRDNPDNGAYAIVAGLEQVVEYVKNLSFKKEDIEYLRALNKFEDDFLDYLENFKFKGDIHAIPEGTVVFPQEPLLKIKSSIIEGQLIEGAVLNIINHQSLIATKASHIVWAANGDTVLEFGLRRAQGPDAAIYGARAAIIGGCEATSNLLAGKMFDVPVSGTHAHSWVMSFENEITAFRAYADMFPENPILLVDTFNTLEQGVPNAIKVFEELKQKGVKFKRYGIRLDSGDLSYISKEARKLLDKAGFTDAIISASSDLDEYLISELKSQGAEISVWGVGTNLITSKGWSAFGGVYKLVAEIGNDKNILPKIKLSENPDKITNPGDKKVFRIYNKKNHKIKADLIALANEKICNKSDLTIFDPKATWKKMKLKANEFEVRELLVPIFAQGECVYTLPTVIEIREYCKKELLTLWGESKRLVNPHVIPVDLSHDLFTLKNDMIKRLKD